MIRFVLILVITMLWWHPRVFAQKGGTSAVEKRTTILLPESKLLHPLKLYDKVPEIQFNDVLNFKKNTVRISDFKGKLLLLDFWSTNCSSCIAAFPKMKELQQEFPDKVQMLTVGFDANIPGDISNYINKQKGTPRQMDLPTAVMAVNDKMMENLFPFTSVPTVIWISPEGRYIGYTHGYSVSSRNIKLALSGGSLEHLAKVDYDRIRFDEDFLFRKIDGKYPYWGAQYAPYKDTPVYSQLDHFFHQLDAQRDSGIWKFRFINKNIKDAYEELYNYKFGKTETIDRFHVICETEGNRVIEDYQDWRERISKIKKWRDEEDFKGFMVEQCFNYEVVLPRTEFSLAQVCDNIIADFDRFLHIKSRIEKRKVKGLAVVTLSSGNTRTFITKSTKDNCLTDYYQDKSRGIESGVKDALEGYPMHKFLHYLYSYSFAPYIVNETRYDGHVNMVIDKGDKNVQMNLPALKVQLRKYGLDLAPVEREIDVLVLTVKR